MIILSGKMEGPLYGYYGISLEHFHDYPLSSVNIHEETFEESLKPKISEPQFLFIYSFYFVLSVNFHPHII